MKIKIFHGPAHEVEDNFNEWTKQLNAEIISTQFRVIKLENWSMGTKMAFVALCVRYVPMEK